MWEGRRRVRGSRTACPGRGVWRLVYGATILLLVLLSHPFLAKAGDAASTAEAEVPASQDVIGNMSKATAAKEDPLVAKPAVVKPPAPPSPPRAKHTEVNYAAITAGAVVLASSSALVGSKNLLDDDKDKYARAPCDQEKWVVINLSEDIKVETLVLANYEKFSSTIKEFDVLYSTMLPQTEDDWKLLGSFTAASKQGEQRFTVQDPQYARYLNFRFKTHWNNEFYCTLSQIKVHGKTLQESFQMDYKKQRQDTMHNLEAIKPTDDFVSLEQTAEAGEVDAPQEQAPPVVKPEEPQAAGAVEAGTCEDAIPRTCEGEDGTPVGGEGQVSEDSGVGEPTLESPAVPQEGLQGGEGEGAEPQPLSAPAQPSLDASMKGQRADTAVAGTGLNVTEEGGEKPQVLAAGQTGKGKGEVSVGGGEGKETVLPASSPTQATAEEAGPPAAATPIGRQTSAPGGEKAGALIAAAAHAAYAEGLGKAAPTAAEVHVPVPPLRAVNVTDAVEVPMARGGSTVTHPSPPEPPVQAAPKVDAVVQQTASSEAAPAPPAERVEPAVSHNVSVAEKPAAKLPASAAAAAAGEGARVGEGAGVSEQPAAPPKPQVCEEKAPAEGKEQVHVDSPAPSVERQAAEGIKAVPLQASRETAPAQVEATVPKREASVSPPSPPPPPSPQQQQQPKQQDGGEEEQQPLPALPQQQEQPQAPKEETVPAGEAPISTTIKVERPAAATAAAPPAPAQPPQGVNGVQVGVGNTGVAASGAVTATPAGVAAAQAMASNGAVVGLAASAAANGKVRRCLEQLAFTEFKKQKLGKLKEDEKRKGGPTMGGGGASPYDNIFKTLMHEITSQEINQSIFDMYVTALQQCLTQAIEELRAEKEKDRTTRDEAIRLLSSRVQNLSDVNQDLLARVHRLETTFMANIATWCAGALCVVLLLLSTCLQALRKQ